MDKKTTDTIISLAARYETADFLTSDPSRFMHMVEGDLNREATAFVASCLSYGSRKQFFPKIQHLLDCSSGEMHRWIESGAFMDDIDASDACYYRLHTCRDLRLMMSAYRDMMLGYGHMKDFIRCHAVDGPGAIAALCRYFHEKGADAMVPRNTSSACKRVCMFLRWMVRDSSPVDLGLWADIIDKRSLIMPLDVHVTREAAALGLISGSSASMSTAHKLTAAMLEIFPDDPLKGDFALFGYGVNKK